MTPDLPELPEPERYVWNEAAGKWSVPAYSAAQMRDYATSAVRESEVGRALGGEEWPIRCLTQEAISAAEARGLKTYYIPGESGVFARPYDERDYVDEPVTNTEADANLAALLNYTGSFYAAAIERGLNAGVAANCVAHVEKAARRLHSLASHPNRAEVVPGGVSEEMVERGVAAWYVVQRSNIPVEDAVRAILMNALGVKP